MMRKMASPLTPTLNSVNKAYFQRVDLSAHGFYITPDVGYCFNGYGGGVDDTHNCAVSKGGDSSNRNGCKDSDR